MKQVVFLFLCATSSLGDLEDLVAGTLQVDEGCHSNLFDEAVELLNTHTVEQLEKQLLMKEDVLREKEEEIQMLKLELENKQQEVEKSWTLVSYMMKVMSRSQEMFKLKEQSVTAQEAKVKEMAEFFQMTQEDKIEEMQKQVTKCSHTTENAVR